MIHTYCTGTVAVAVHTVDVCMYGVLIIMFIVYIHTKYYVYGRNTIMYCRF
jgi:hypothetical protein